ncbi:hypothetical protein KK062_20365 [Fulvivirgaceae bacterium PWU5]|uniref:Uncharacterized protein n=1 Tax=Dawidia cretensis TaxID=2782350 RepID=A0AAP2GRS8_9BACT|nr:hypothetical protein [Dawidia cretensis]MBT1710609.1 hypothetical protein [Dawidia cretensis]
MNTTFLNTIPVLPTTDIDRDVRWYQEKMGLQLYFADKMYAVLYRDNPAPPNGPSHLIGKSIPRIIRKKS